MSKQVENAHNLYIHAIQDGCVSEAQAQSVGDTYIQHSTGVPDGKEGFAAFFANFFECYPEREMKIVRTIEDGNLVFVHVSSISQWRGSSMGDDRYFPCG